MRIAFFTECYHPTRNGVVVSVDTFARELIALGHEVHIFAPRFARFQDHGDFPVHRFPSVTSLRVPDYPLSVPLAPGMFRLFERLDFDLVHAHNPWLIGRSAAYLARKWRKPLVLTYHTLFTQYMHYVPAAEVFTRPIALWVLRDYTRRCQLVIAPSPEVAASLKREGKIGAPIVSLPTGIDHAFIAGGDRGRGRAQLGMSGEARLLIYVGRVAHEKNLDFLLEALAPVLRARADTHLIAVGGGPYLNLAPRRAEQLGIAAQSHFVGSVPRTVVRDFLAAGDLFVFASRTETQGIVLAEAMAAGLPIVAIDATGVSSAVRDEVDGFLVRPDKEQFGRCVIRLLDDDRLHASMSLAARERSQDFSARRSAEDLVSLYQEVLSRFHCVDNAPGADTLKRHPRVASHSI